jgi:hypothetical protein
MTVKSILAALSLTVSVAATPAVAAAASPCVSAADETALNARVLQTELMVAALSCHEQTRYNTFVRTFRSQIAEQSASLRRLFDRAYGRSGTRELNAYVTRLANDASIRSANDGQRYCTSSAALLSEALATPPHAFERLTHSASVRGRHGFSRCN